MTRCYFCGESIGFLSFQYYCKHCSDLRRVLLLQDSVINAIKKIKKLFLIDEDEQPLTEQKPKENLEEIKEKKQEEEKIKKYTDMVKEFKKNN